MLQRKIKNDKKGEVDGSSESQVLVKRFDWSETKLCLSSPNKVCRMLSFNINDKSKFMLGPFNMTYTYLMCFIIK